MLKFTYVVNLGLVGALVVPATLQGSGVRQLEDSLRATDQALTALDGVGKNLTQGDYAGVEAILAATEEPFGGPRERSQLIDQLRRDIGDLEATVQTFILPEALGHLSEDPTADMASASEDGTNQIATTGLTPEQRTEVGNIWPPVPDSDVPVVRKSGEYDTLEEVGFTVDAVRQGRAYYRAKRYKEALRLFTTREGEPEADYWIGRSLERLGRPTEAVAAYSRVIENEASGPLAERAQMDLDFLQWLIDFDRDSAARRSSGGNR
jgi:tetratricopeptide (TPR) repeat protein